MLYDPPREPPDTRDPDDEEDEFWERSDYLYERKRDREMED